jgi:hypothetical protein
MDEAKNALDTKVPECLIDRQVYLEVTGNSLYWFILEILVFFANLMTLMILMMKSRCINIGVNQTH